MGFSPAIDQRSGERTSIKYSSIQQLGTIQSVIDHYLDSPSTHQEAKSWIMAIAIGYVTPISMVYFVGTWWKKRKNNCYRML